MNSEIAWSDEHTIYLRGMNLCDEVIGTTSLTELLVLEVLGRRPTQDETRMLDALLVSVAEHGITPSVIAARVTYLGAPESLQGAIASGLLGAGDRYLGTSEQAARMLGEALAAEPEADLEQVSEDIVSRLRSERTVIPGVGHPIHKDADPRAARLSELARKSGFLGRHTELLYAVSTAASAQMGRSMPVNGAGIVGSIAADMGFPTEVIRGLGVVARTVGLVGHLFEEMRNPLGSRIWNLVASATEHP